VGNTVAQAWTHILAGKSGIGPITKFDVSTFACKIAGEVKGFDLGSYMSAKEARTMDTFIHFGVAAASQAVADAGLPTGLALDDDLANRIGCVLGSGIGGLQMIEEVHGEFMQRGARRISPFFVPSTIVNMVAGHVMLIVFATFVVMIGSAGVIGYFGAVLPLAINVILVGFELLVAFLQAYVFAILTSIYLHDAVHLH
jgi:3-oxoacyl-(acyl-carrier-protein) synthase